MNKSKLFHTTLFTFAFLLFTFAFSFAQENNTVKTDTLKTANTNQPNSPQAEQGDVKITDGTNTLIRITDEGTFGAIEIKNGVPSATTDKLYNDAGTLKFNGSSLGGGSGVTEINDLSDAQHDGTNLFIGNFSGLSYTTGTTNTNTAIGYESLKNITTGGGNTAIGNVALKNNTIGSQNTSIGNSSMVSNTEGNYNVATGVSSLYGNTTGNRNTANGHSALSSNQSGDNNTAIGYQALKSNTIGYSNVANGYNVLKTNTTGYLNTGNGYNALELNTEGFHNTADGVYALNSNTTGETNTAIGSNALRFNTIGNNNTANGMRTLYSNTTGNNNTGLGTDALFSNTTGSGNVALGFEAGKNELGSNKLYIENSNSSFPLIWGDFANDEVKINGDFEVTGSVALGSNTTANGANSVAIGSYASTNNLSGSMILADNSTTTVLNSSSVDRMTMRFDKGYRLYSDAAASVGVYMNAGGNSWLSISDSTKKENFQSVNGEELLNKISQFKLTTWNYKTQDPTKFRHYGPMAQDFYAAFGNDGIGVIGNDTTIASADFDGINFNAIHALEKRTKIQEASIKYQDKRIKTLEEENENLKKQFVKNVNLENKIELLEQALNKLIKAQPQIKVSKK